MRTKRIFTKVLVALALTFMIPQLVFLYMWEDLSTRSTLLLFASTILLIGIGAHLIWDIVRSIRAIFRNIDEITKSDLSGDEPTSSDELEIMGSSIEVISKKIVENMEDLQRSTALIEKTKKDLNDTLLYVESVMNSMGDALIVIDSEYKIKRINQMAKSLLKYDEDDLIARTIDSIFEYIDENAFFNSKGVTGKRMSCITMENEKIPVDVNIQPLIDLNDTRIGHVLVVRDMRVTLDLISRLEKANTSLEVTVQERTQALQKSCETLKMKDAQILQQEKMASIGVLTAGIAHEINNPVGYISSNMELLQESLGDIISYTQLLEYGLAAQTKENDAKRRVLEMDQIKQVQARMKVEKLFSDSEKIIKESGQGLKRIKRIIHDLRMFSHSDENKMISTDLNHEIQNTLNIVEHELKHKAEIVTQFEFVPPLNCYPQQLNQVFMNLLINASHAVSEGDVIHIRTHYRDGQIYVVFKDTGTGIPAENLKKIFDPFFTTKSVGKGTGLGLYISYGIVEKHKGTLSVESKLGEGTTFTIKLPVAHSESLVHPAMTIPAIQSLH
ncbi:MAG: PAS domain-containing protein [Nitrospirae bacterium]|nr:PAS domain-containing protein [Candidatus Manganitrophaceae bacterium]